MKDKHKSFKPSRLYIFHDKFAEFLIEEGITTQLHMACRKGQKSKVLQLIKDGHEVNSAPAGEFFLKFIFLINLITFEFSLQKVYTKLLENGTVLAVFDCGQTHILIWIIIGSPSDSLRSLQIPSKYSRIFSRF